MNISYTKLTIALLFLESNKMLHFKSAAVYWSMSTLMVFVNKNIMTTWHFNFPLFLVSLEMIITIVTVIILANSRIINFPAINKLRNFLSPHQFFRTLDYFKYPILTSLFYTLHSVISLRALNGLSISMYIILKRCGPFVNFVISFFMFKNQKKTHSKKIKFSILAMTSGVIIAGNYLIL